jgi:hypothetical protein
VILGISCTHPGLLHVPMHFRRSRFLVVHDVYLLVCSKAEIDKGEMDLSF